MLRLHQLIRRQDVLLHLTTDQAKLRVKLGMYLFIVLSSDFISEFSTANITCNCNAVHTEPILFVKCINDRSSGVRQRHLPVFLEIR